MRKSTKTAKAKTAKTAAKKTVTSARRSLPRAAWENIRDSLKIKVVGENPRHKGSGPWKIYEQMGKCRTVASYVEKGFSKRWLPGAVKREYIELVGK